MFHKNTLFEQNIFTAPLSKTLDVNEEQVKENILEGYQKQKLKKDLLSGPKDQYFNIKDQVHTKWIVDYLTDNFKLKYNKSLIITNTFGLIQIKGQEISQHQHIDDYDIHGSPDMSVIFTVDTGEIPSFIEFEFSGGRKRNLFWREPLKKNQFIIFNSELRHRFSKNYNSDPTYNLAFNFQII